MTMTGYDPIYLVILPLMLVGIAAIAPWLAKFIR
jgi:hypothetical protein